MPAIRAELFLFVGLLDIRRCHGLRERQRQGVSVVGLALPRFCSSALLSSTAHCVASTI
jgi:hypothetical protein